MAVDAISGVVPDDVAPVTILGQDVQTPVEILAKKEHADIPLPVIKEQQQQQKEPQLSKEELDKLTKNLNQLMDAFDISARFSVHEATKDIMVRIYNSRTNETIREIPPKKILDMVANMMKLVGMLLDEKA